MRKIAIFGLASNPPTLGHAHVVKSILALNKFDEVWVLPVYKHFHGKEMIAFEHRVEMARLAFKNMPKVKVFPYEMDFALKHDYDGSTINLLKHLRELESNDYYIVIGQDNADTIETWNHGSELKENEKFIVLPRPNCYLVEEWYHLSPNVFLSSLKSLDISSTMARDLLKEYGINGQLVKLNKLLDHDVIEYITWKKLYRG